jgi:peptidyl-prolyl cis-trans isomerase D
MLQEIRERAQGWFAWAIVILISIPFALWGIQEYLGVGSIPVVAKVNSQEINERDLDLAVHRQRPESGEPVDAETGLAQRRQAVLDGMIRETLLVQAAEAMKMRASDATVVATIHSVPAFQRDGQFDVPVYQQALRQQGMAEATFEQQLRRLLVTDQLVEGIRGSAFVTPGELRDSLRLTEQQRDVGYFVLRRADFTPAAPPSDADVAAYYERNRDAFQSPERAQIEYLELDAARLAAGVRPDEDAVKGYFEQHRDEFAQRPQRRSRHILFAVDAAAGGEPLAAAEAKAKAALERLRQGEDFAVLAKELSDDPGSAGQGGDLGWFERGVMVKEFEDAAFSLPVGQVSEPVRSPFGLHVIEVTEARDTAEPDLDAVRGRVVEALQRAEAERIFYDQLERLSDLTYENSGSLDPAAEALGLKSATTDWFGREGGLGVLASPKVVAAAFSDEVRGEGRNSEPIEIGPEHTVVLRVRAYEPARLRPLGEVREEVAARLTEEQAAAAARARASELLARARAGEALDALAKEAGAGYERVARLGRRAAAVPPAIAQAAFALPRVGAGSAPSLALVDIGNGDVAVAGLFGVEEPAATPSEAQAQGLRTVLEAQHGAVDLGRYQQALRDRAELEVKPLSADTSRSLD